MTAAAAESSLKRLQVPSEEIPYRKLDLALRDTAWKFGAGIALGGLLSLLYKRKRWPIIFGGSFGLGMGFSNFQHSLKQPLPHIYTTD